MARDRRIPRFSPVSVDISVDGKIISEKDQIVSVVVKRAVNKVSEASLVFFVPPDGEAEVSLDESLVPGKDIEIKVAKGGRPRTIFKGVIMALRLRSGKQGALRLHLHCSDRSVKMTLGPKNRLFSETDDHSAMAAILAENGLSAAVGATSVTHPQLLQYDATDWDFLLTRARANGMILTNLDGKVTIDRPAVTSVPLFAVAYGQDLYDFDLELNASAQMVNVLGRAWDAGQQEVTAAASQEPAVNQQGDISGLELAQTLDIHDYRLQTSGQVPAAELDDWANARLLAARLARIKGTLEFSGSADVLPDTVIEIEGLSGRFNGNAYVSAVTHTIEEGDWRTAVAVGLEEEWFVDAGEGRAAAAGLLPGMSGMHIGIVTGTDGDPAGEGRIQVKLPLVDPEGDGIWARPAAFYASAESGAFFLPEVGDEVVVSFLNDDPRFPIVIGSLYSSARRPPFQPDPDNSMKGILTRNGLKLEFNDQDERMTIATAGGNEIVLSEKNRSLTLKDQNGNSLVMTSAGITITSIRDLTLSASGNVKLEGVNVEAKAQAAFSAEGAASAKVESSGITTVKGSMVMIN